MKSLTELVEELARITKLTPIDLRYSSRQWAVFQPYGNETFLIHGSFRETPEEAVKFCIRKWNHRSNEKRREDTTIL